jgi:L-lactate dehydrogenase complex protein LldG
VTARDEVLHRIRVALTDGGAGGGRESAEAASGDVAGPATDSRPGPGYRSQGSLGPAELMDLLAERITDYRATVRRCDQANLTSTVAATLTARAATIRARPGRSGAAGLCRIVRPAGLAMAGLDLAGLERAVRPGGVELVPDDGLSAAELDAMDGVLTGAAVAIAQTGTIVLDGSAGQGRRAITLVPDYHLCVVAADQVVELVPEAVARLAPSAGRPLTWISGPSATSDIELNRVEGVHGPRTLEVVLVHPA